MIYRREVPFILTILFGVLGFTLRTFSDRLSSYSFVEYSYSSGTDDRGTFIGYEILNATNDKVYKNLLFSILAVESDSLNFRSGKIIAQPPLNVDNIDLDRSNSDILGDDYANFSLEYLMPQTKYFVKIYYEGRLSNAPGLLFKVSEMAKANVDLTNPVIVLKSANIFTWLARRQFEVLTALILLWTISIVVYIKLSNHEPTSTNLPNAEAGNLK